MAGARRVQRGPAQNFHSCQDKRAAIPKSPPQNVGAFFVKLLLRIIAIDDPKTPDARQAFEERQLQLGALQADDE
jgi:hypothetical protein